ncbi:FCS-Like Zinc finger 10-like [Abrus precatorius]|uniref:FCS-Like Zinc finger 10-like n=1 Tax=Abrus precatorius TaxID=3816 RepID=A0A8B8LGS9_ABRPR|nr:FCS-Like Zinc finger 10-like [Abrus precatorius]
MLRKRNRSVQKDQHHMNHPTISDANLEYYSQSHHALGRNIIKGHSIFNVPCLFVGLGPKGLDSDAVRSPTSPLDARGLSNLGNPVRKPRSSPNEGHQRSWDCCKVGLSIVESLEDCSRFCGKILQSPESKKISLSSQMMIKTTNCQTYNRDSLEASKSLPKDFCKVPYTQNGSVIHKGEPESTVLFEIGETCQDHELFGRTRSCSLDSCSPLKTLSGLTKSDSDIDNFALKDMNILVSSPPHFIGGSQNSNTFPPSKLNSNTLSICSSNEFLKSLSASDIEHSEDYTCVISHGPNPKTTHIFGDCILETHSNAFKNHFKNEEKEVNPGGDRLESPNPNPYPSSDFLSFCHHCNRKLEDGKDIYIYGGEKAFCSLTCRAMEIMIDEELEESTPSSENYPKPKFGEQLFETGILTAT